MGDFNRDGVQDLAIANYSRVAVLLGNGDGSFQAPLYFASGSHVSVAVGDFNGDGMPDIVVTNFQSENISVLINTLAPVCPPYFPIECQLLCTDLQAALGAPGITPMQREMLRGWLLGYRDSGGCETDILLFHRDAAVCADALAQIHIRTSRFTCFHFPLQCYFQIAQCMMDNPETWSWELGHCF